MKKLILIPFLLFSIALFGQSKTHLYLGTTDNDGTGTPLKAGGSIINDNFDAVQNSVDSIGTIITTNSTDTQTALDLKLSVEDYATLTYGSTVTWAQANHQYPLAKVTATGNFTIDMTNVKSGSSGILKLITNTASAITVTFDSDFTNKTVNSTFSTYTYPALTAQEYFLTYTVDGTTIEWNVGDPTGSIGNYSAWTITWTGFSANPTGVVSRYTLIGKMCTIYVNMTGHGTSNATTLTITLPFTASSSIAQRGTLATVTDNSAAQTSPGLIVTTAGSNVATLYKTAAAGAWTGSGSKSAQFNFTYEIQ